MGRFTTIITARHIFVLIKKEVFVLHFSNKKKHELYRLTRSIGLLLLETWSSILFIEQFSLRNRPMIIRVCRTRKTRFPLSDALSMHIYLDPMITVTTIGLNDNNQSSPNRLLLGPRATRKSLSLFNAFISLYRQRISYLSSYAVGDNN